MATVTVSDHDDALHLRGDGRFVVLSADAHNFDELKLLFSFPSLIFSPKNFSEFVAVRIVASGVALPESYSMMMMMALFKMVVVSCAWVTFLAILACVVHSVVFENLVVLVQHLGIQRLVLTLPTLTFALVFDSSFLHASCARLPFANTRFNVLTA